MIKVYSESHRLQVLRCIAVCLLMVPNAIYSTPVIADEKDNPHQSAPTAPVFIPEGVVVGNLLYKVEPEYPRIAKAARVSGIVTLRATISKAGEIENLRVICGPQMLLDASIKAVQQWKYRPYVLHGEPVEVETTIRVIFALGGKKKLKFSEGSCPDQ
jgi:TonB family protein